MTNIEKVLKLTQDFDSAATLYCKRTSCLRVLDNKMLAYIGKVKEKDDTCKNNQINVKENWKD